MANTERVPVLRDTFQAAEAELRGGGNDAVARVIADEAGSVRYENVLDVVFEGALKAQGLEAKRPYKRIDIAVRDAGKIVVAIECKGMVANSHSTTGDRAPLDVHGIRTKLEPSARSRNCVLTDMQGLANKIPPNQRGPHLQVFVPVAYELYRQGGRDEWHRESKPWTTHPSFREIRGFLRRDLANWFHAQEGPCELLYATEEPIALRRANEFWLQSGKKAYPAYNALEAYVSFYAFFREVGA